MQLGILFRALKQLLNQPKPTRKQIGYKTEKKDNISKTHKNKESD
jgi:hypothetical protein